MQSPSDTDHYRVLGVQKTASQDDVRKAYKRLAKEWHPDKNLHRKADAEKKFKEISEAHRVLSDEQLRFEYDHAKAQEERNRYHEAQRRRTENVRRMGREQEEYVRKQEEKRRKAQRMRNKSNLVNNTIYDFGDSERAFQNFFEDRETWRNTMPNLFGSEASSVEKMMKELLNMSNNISFGGARDFTSYTGGFTDSSNINDTFDRFFADDSFTRYQR